MDFLPRRVYSGRLTDCSTNPNNCNERKMAKKKTGVSKSQAIRNYLATNPKATPNEIVAALGKKGIKVSPGLAGNVKYTSGLKRRKKKTGKKRVVKRRRPGRRSVAKLSADDLLAARQLADQLGGIQEARRALETLERLA